MQAVDAVKAGGNPEDDRIEFKRSWPAPEKARQLAAAANQARGDHLIYVIGVDDKAGTVHPLDGTDPAIWWSQMAARFDDLAPDLVRHIGVQISTTERVVALLFRTDRVPYVVKVNKEGGSELEVPIRDATRTRSAKRHELIRLLYPVASVPQLTVISGELEHTANFDRYTPAHVALWLSIEVLFEPASSSPVFLPWHSASAALDLGERLLHTEIIPRAERDGRPSDALHVRHDGIRVSEPGVANIQAHWEIPLDQAKELELRKVDRWPARIGFAATGSDRVAEARMVFGNRRRSTFTDSTMRDDEDLAHWRWTLEGPPR